MNTGKVKFFNRKKGFGFLIDDSDQSDIFVHITAINDKKEPFITDDAVSFDYSENKNGRCADNVKKINP